MLKLTNLIANNTMPTILFISDKVLPTLSPSSQVRLTDLSSKQEKSKPNARETLVNGISVALDLTDEILNCFRVL